MLLAATPAQVIDALHNNQNLARKPVTVRKYILKSINRTVVIRIVVLPDLSAMLVVLINAVHDSKITGIIDCADMSLCFAAPVGILDNGAIFLPLLC